MKFGSDLNAKLAKLETTIKANLPIILTFKGRIEQVANVTGTLTANVNGFAELKPVCLGSIVYEAGKAGVRFDASIKATTTLTGSLN